MKFEDMDKKRKEQVTRQVAEFNRRFENREDSYDLTDIILTPELTLDNYTIHKDAFQSDKMTSVEFARWVAYNNGEYNGKEVIDMFCGGGIQGIVALMRGAAHATFVDYCAEACQTTVKNLNQYGLRERATVIQSDLFDNIVDKADLIVANPPFFPCEPVEGEPISIGMCLPVEKMEEFYRKAADYAPMLAACHWDFAGPENDPETLGPKTGWKTTTRLLIPIGFGIQKATERTDEYHFKVSMLER
ncbi:methyltransferase [Candidatus Woesearchaeota archaeon]|nr:methyltransferase [Candidatus Woesearchaeota archaeon]